MKKNQLKPLILSVVFIVFIQCSKEEEPLTVQDSDGNIYSTVQIGEHVWLAENLKTTTLNDGSQLPNLDNPNTWVSSSEAGYCWYNNDAAANKNLYGALYNYKTIKTGKICPPGWHVPNDSEWNTLVTFLGGDNLATVKLKSTGTTPWSNNATNDSGFSAQPGGFRWSGFNSLEYSSCWWSSSSTDNLTHYLQMSYKSEILSTSSTGYGYSIRCIKDN